MTNKYKGIDGGWPTYPSVDWSGFFPKINQNYYGLSGDMPIPLNEVTVKGNAPKWYRDMSNEERAFRDYVNYRNSNPEAWKEDAPTISTYNPLTYEESRSQQARQAAHEKHRQLASYYARQSPTLSNLLSAFDNWTQGAGIAPMDEYKPIGEPVMLLGGPQNIAQLSRTARMVREFENAANEMDKAKEASVVAGKLFPTRNPQIRTRLGDVEMNNPNLLYHLDRGDGRGAFSNRGAYIKEGKLYPGEANSGQIPYTWWNLGKPYSLGTPEGDFTRLITANPSETPFLHVRSQNYPIGQWNGKKGFVTNSEYVASEPVNASESTYNYVPGYGWRKVTQEPPAISWENGYQPIQWSDTGTTMEGIQNFIDNDIIPRIQRQGHNIEGYTPNVRILDWNNLDAYDRTALKGNPGAWFTPSINEVTFKNPVNQQNFGLAMHEVGGHGLRYNMQPDYRFTTRSNLNAYLEGNVTPEIQKELLNVHTGTQMYNPIEIQKLQETYPWVKNHPSKINAKNPNSVLQDQGAINTQFRANLSDNGRIVGKDLDKVIDETSDEKLLWMLRDQPYTHSIVDELSNISGIDAFDIESMSMQELSQFTKYSRVKEILNNMRSTMKEVGMYGMPAIIGGGLLYGIGQGNNNKIQ